MLVVWQCCLGQGQTHRSAGQIGAGIGPTGGQRATPVIQACQSNIQASPLVVEQMRFGNFDVFEFHSGLPCAANATFRAVARSNFDALHVWGADQGGDFVLGFPRLWINDLLLAHHGEDAGQCSAGGPFFSARTDDEITVLVHLNPCFLSSSIASHIGFREAEGRKRVFADARKEGGLLGFGPEEHDGTASDEIECITHY